MQYVWWQVEVALNGSWQWGSTDKGVYLTVLGLEITYRKFLDQSQPIKILTMLGLAVKECHQNSRHHNQHNKTINIQITMHSVLTMQNNQG
jgi:hypothetical protein